MSECYFCTCINHYKDEPLCKLDQCIATETELKEYTIIRLKYLKKYDLLEEFAIGGE